MLRTWTVIGALLLAVSSASAAGKDVKGFGLYHWGMTVEEVLAANKKAPAHRADGQLGKLHVQARTTVQVMPKADPLEQEFLFDDAGKLRGISFAHPELPPERQIAECEALEKHFTGVWGPPSRVERSSDNTHWDVDWQLGRSEGAMHCSMAEGRRLMNLQLRQQGYGN